MSFEEENGEREKKQKNFLGLSFKWGRFGSENKVEKQITCEESQEERERKKKRGRESETGKNEKKTKSRQKEEEKNKVE